MCLCCVVYRKLHSCWGASRCVEVCVRSNVNFCIPRRSAVNTCIIQQAVFNNTVTNKIDLRVFVVYRTNKIYNYATCISTKSLNLLLRSSTFHQFSQVPGLIRWDTPLYSHRYYFQFKSTFTLIDTASTSILLLYDRSFRQFLHH